MSYDSVMQNGYNRMRKQDVTADDAAFDGSSSGARYTDITKREVFFFDTGANVVEIMFYGEGDDGDTFGVEIWNVIKGGYAEYVADITGALGTAYADITNRDSTERLFADDVTISDSDHLKGVTIADQGNNRYSKITYSPFGAIGGCVRFYNVGGVGEVARIVPMIRFF